MRARGKETEGVLAMKICVRIEGTNGNVADIGFDTEEQANSFISDDRITDNKAIKTAYIFWPKCEVKNANLKFFGVLRAVLHSVVGF